MILKVGLTGGIASGKSTVAKMLESLGCTVVDADHIVRDLYRRGERGYQAIVDRYGSDVLTSGEEIDRARLSEVALATPESAEQLNRLIHPLVIERERAMLDEYEQMLGERDAIVVVEATLLLEAGGRQRYDRIVVVDVDPEIQIERAVERGMLRDEVLRRIARQLPREERLRRADYVIRTGGNLESTREETRRVHECLTRDLVEIQRGL